MRLDQTPGIVALLADILSAITNALGLRDRHTKNAQPMSGTARTKWYRNWIVLPVATVVVALGWELLTHPQKQVTVPGANQKATGERPPSAQSERADIEQSISLAPKSPPLPKQQARRQPGNETSSTSPPTGVKGKGPRQSDILSTPPQPTQQNTQSCISSNCVQGDNYGSQTINQYGPPKLVMTDEQQKTITAAMKPLPGMRIIVMTVGDTQDVFVFGSRLVSALNVGGMSAEMQQTLLYGAPGGTPSGISLEIGDDRSPDALALATAMVQAHLVRAPIYATSNHQDRDALTVIVEPYK